MKKLKSVRTDFPGIEVPDKDDSLAVRRKKIFTAALPGYPVFIYFISMVLLGMFFSVLVLGEEITTVELEQRLAAAVGKERVEILIKLAGVYKERTPPKALEYGKTALALLETFPSAAQQVKVLNFLSEASALTGDFQRAEAYARQSKTIAERIGDKAGVADALYNLAQVYYSHSDYPQASTFSLQALKEYKKIGHQKGMAQSYYSLANIYWRLSDYSRAMDYIMSAYKIYKKLDDTLGMANLDFRTGTIYSSLGQFDKSLEYYFKAKQIFETMDEKFRLANTLNNMGRVYNILENHSVALNCFNKALEISREINSRTTMSYALNNMGDLYAAKGEYSTALDYFHQSLEIKEGTGDQMGISYTLISIGKVLHRQGQYKAAIQPLKRALEVAARTGIKTDVRNANKELSDIYEALGEYSQALYYLTEYKEINDFIFNDSSSQRLTVLETRYQKDKKEKEIALLTKDQEIRALALKRKKNINYMILLVSFFVFILVVVFYIRYRLKIKMTRALSSEIAQHQQTTQKLMESEEKFRVLTETSRAGIYIVQEDVIKYVNPGFLAIFGYSREEILGQSPAMLVTEADQSFIMARVHQRLVNHEDGVCYEFKGITREGETVYLESYGGLIRYQGRPAVLETIIDITHRKKTEEKWHRTQRLEAMGILAGGIAHDFNNLLAVLVGYADMLGEELQKGTAAAVLVENIEKAYREAVELGGKLFSFSQSGWIVPQELTLDSILQVVLDIQSHPEMESFQTDIFIPPGLSSIYGDERQLKQVFRYLFHSAGLARGTDSPGQTLVTIRAENTFLEDGNDFTLEQGEYLRILFTITGWSIPVKIAEKIFEPFFNEWVPQPRQQRGGMGLELAICKSIIKKHKGHLGVSSGPGNDTAFRILLPALPSAS